MRKIITIALSLMLVLGLGACSLNKETVPKEEKVETLEELGIESQNVDVTVFDVVENKDVDKKIEIENPSPENIAISIMKELGYTGEEILSVTEKDNSIYVDFKKDSKFLKGGTAEEVAVLDSLGLTFVGNLKYDHIYVAVEGEEYESGHMYLELDEPYM